MSMESESPLNGLSKVLDKIMTDTLYNGVPLQNVNVTTSGTVTSAIAEAKGQMQNNVTKTPLFHPPAPEQCECTEFVSDYRFAGTCKTFKCKYHGTVTIDRRPLVVPPPLSLPNTGLQWQPPQWVPNAVPAGPVWINSAGGIVPAGGLLAGKSGLVVTTGNTEPIWTSYGPIDSQDQIETGTDIEEPGTVSD